VARRVSPSERLRAQIDGLFASERDLTSVLEDVARLSVRLMVQTAVEAEVDEFLGPGPLRAPGRRGPARFPQRLAAAGDGQDDDGPGSCSAPSCGTPTRRSVPGCSAPG
jgi:hypothetical protein